MRLTIAKASTRRFIRDRSANVALLFCFAAVPIVFGTGAGLDYVMASRRREQLNAAADGAALLTVNTAMMTQSANVAQAAATAFFTGQVQRLGNVNLVAPVTVTVIDSAGQRGTVRNTSVSYQAASSNVFAGVLGRSNLQIGGQAAASSSAIANEDFYLLLDTSPSMAIAATPDGITQMQNATQSQGGCGFACHQSNPGVDGLSEDNYSIARRLGIALRMDLVVKAATDFPTYAQNVANKNHVQYRMGIWTFDYQFAQVLGITSDFPKAQSAAGNVQMLEVYSNNYLTQNNYNNDQDTNWSAAIQAANATMPPAGKGTNNSGDSPRETIFIVTDGVADEANGGRQIYAMGGDGCTQLKARGVKIAVLYTYYNPLPQNGFYNAFVKPFQPNIGPTLQACASDGLFTTVQSGGDVSAALQSLFNKSLTVAHLTN